MSYTVYVLKSAENNTYVGMTNNIERRLKEHNTRQSRYTRKGTGWRVIYKKQLPTRR